MKALAPVALLVVALPAWAGPLVKASFDVPTLDVAGVALLAVLVGGVASWAVRRRKK